jgi:AraC family transcriptional regulator of adaptative response/methylated-DNA-[protein]-cysteine methyltransferase
MRDLLSWLDDLPPDARIRDGDLRARSIDPARARRHFQKHFGMTFQAYQRARRLASAMREVREGAALAATPYRNGYESESGFRDAFSRLFGDPPSRADRVECLLAHWVTSPLGSLFILASERGICLLEFVDRRALELELKQIRERFGAAIVPGRNNHIEQLSDELAQYFDGRLTAFSTPLDVYGTPF